MSIHWQQEITNTQAHVYTFHKQIWIQLEWGKIIVISLQ
jgi:hypothetical protein